MPPTLGGKSLVTSRWDTAGPRVRRGISRSAPAYGRRPGEARRRLELRSHERIGVVATPATSLSRSARPSRRAAQTAWARSSGSASAQRPARAPPRPRGSAGRRRCPAPPGRCGAGSGPGGGVCTSGRAGPAARRRSPPAGRARRRPRSASGPARRAGCDAVGAAVGRAHLLAVVAAVEPVAERDAVVARERAVGLQQPRQAPPGVDHARGDDGAGRDSRRGSGCTAAAVGHRLVADVQRRVGDDRSQHEPAALPGQEQVGVLAVPAEPGPVGGLAVDEGVVVGHDPAAPAARPQPWATTVSAARSGA